MLPFHWQGIVDLAVLAAAIYLMLRWAREARVVRIALGLLGLHVASLLAGHFDLVITGWLLDSAALVGIAVVVLVYQSDLRNALARLDILRRIFPRKGSPLTPTLLATGNAAFALARGHLGALMVIVRHDPVTELVSGGLGLGGRVSSEILEAIFQKVSPVHDGAVIIDNDRITRVGVVLPLSQREDVPSYYGTRHRAAMGLAERSDAVVIIVSEERSEVTLVHGRNIIRVESLSDLSERLRALVSSPPELASPWRRLLFADLGLRAAAVGIAAAVWFISNFVTGQTARMVSVPIEFVNVPNGLEVTSQSASTLAVQLQASAWLVDSIGIPQLVAHVDLSTARRGTQDIQVEPRILNLPPGFAVGHISPQALAVRLTPSSRPRVRPTK